MEIEEAKLQLEREKVIRKNRQEYDHLAKLIDVLPDKASFQK